MVFTSEILKNGQVKNPRFDLEVSEVAKAITIIVRTEILREQKAP